MRRKVFLGRALAGLLGMQGMASAPAALPQLEEVAKPVVLRAPAEKLVASGGLCTPMPLYYEILSPGESPVRDALGSFRADRGEVA